MERSRALTLVARPLGTTIRNHEQIDDAATGDVAVLSGVEGDARFVGRVTSIGLTVGCEVQVLQNVHATGASLRARQRDIRRCRRLRPHRRYQVRSWRGGGARSKSWAAPRCPPSQTQR